MIQIRSLQDTSMEVIHAAVIDAFSDYAEPYNKTLAEQRYLVERRGYDGSLSFGAFDGDRLVSYTLNGVGTWNGHPTAYDTGTGTVKEYRQQGLAARVFETARPVLQANGIKQYLLEVIKVNTKAFDLYRKQGFRISRELDYYVTGAEDVGIRKTKPDNFRIATVDIPGLDLLCTFWSFEPSWQNSIASLSRKPGHFTFLGIFDNEKLAGYGVIERHTGDIPQFAIAPEYRRQGLGTALFDALIRNSETGAVRLINADASYEPFRKFMTSMGLQPGYGQYEMIMEL